MRCGIVKNANTRPGTLFPLDEFWKDGLYDALVVVEWPDEDGANFYVYIALARNWLVKSREEEKIVVYSDPRKADLFSPMGRFMN